MMDRATRSKSHTRLCVVGAGSTYTPELVEGLVRRRDEVVVDELVLHDIDPKRLATLAGLTTRMLRAAEMPTTVVTEPDVDRAVADANAVFVQIRVGGQAARLIDETVPARHGLLGQETTGAGGFAKALRTVPVVLDIAERVRARAQPGAWLINFTNPVGIVTRALLDDGHRTVGLCNFAVGLERRLAGFLEVSSDRVQVVTAGLNHLSWVRAVLVDGDDVLPELLETFAPSYADELGIDPALCAALGALPSTYLRYYYERDATVAAQAHQRPRAAEVADLEGRLLAAYDDPALDHKPDLLAERGGAFYSEAAANLVTSLLAGRARTQVVNGRNGGALQGLADDDVVEMPFTVDDSGVQPLPAVSLAPDMLGLVQAVTTYERLTVKAAVTGDYATARRALLAHPLIGQWRLAGEVLDDLLLAGADRLPAFAR
ncbi:6-phospho-beta-glucosidase [soil metagenome]